MPVCGNYLFFELPKKIVLNPKDGELQRMQYTKRLNNPLECVMIIKVWISS